MDNEKEQDNKIQISSSYYNPIRKQSRQTSLDEQNDNTSEKMRKFIINVTNQTWEIEHKISQFENLESIKKNVEKLKTSLFDYVGIEYEDPIGQPYNETRTDCNASISGSTTNDLVVIETLKPIIRYYDRNRYEVVQQAIVIVKSKIEKGEINE